MQFDYYKLVKDFGAAFNNHDADSLVSMMTDDAVFYTIAGSSAFGNKIVGTSDIKNAFEAVWALMPDANWREEKVFVDNDNGLSQWVFTGTNKETGDKIAAQGCDVFTFKNGKIAVKNAFRKNIVL